MRSNIIIPSSGIVELMDDVDIALTYQIADIKDPQKRHADYSKTINVPGTHNNNKMFQAIFDIGIDRIFNPNKKASCILMVDSTAVMKGYMRLKNIVRVDTKISYEIEITGRLADLFTVLGDSKLRDLSWSDLDHTYNQANQIASWSGTIGSNYVYPFIDYGFTLNEIDYEVNHFFPGVYYKEIWERIMRWAGFQISSPSNFFTSSPFKNLVLPFNSDKMRLTTSQIDARRFRASRESTAQSLTVTYPTAAYSYNTLIFNDDSTSPNQDSGGVYNSATGVWTCGASGYYYVAANVNVKLKVVTSAGSAGDYESVSVFGQITNVTTNSVIALSAKPLIQVSTTSAGTFYSPFVDNLYMSSNGPIYISAGTTVRIETAHIATKYGTATISSSALEIQLGSSFIARVDPDIKEGDTVTFENVLPDMKMADFVMGVIKAFNIFTEYDKDVPNKLIMEPRNSFYGTTTQDWTQKRDLSRELEIVPMGALQARYYLFTYKEDKDHYNAKYLNENGEIYGQRKITVDNDFLKNTFKEELPFSPTPMDSSSAAALSVQSTSNNDRYFPKIINVDSQGKVTPKVSNPRMLYYGGLKQCKPWNYKSVLNATSSGVTHYPYIGHMDDCITPTVDLNFGVPNEVYYDPAFNAIISDNNLYNVYWKQEIDEITDKNSSIVTGWFRLTNNDISLLNFRDVYRFDFQNFRLNKIYDFNPLRDGLTKCEFIKIKNGIPFTSTTGNLTGGLGVVIGGGVVKPKKKISIGGNGASGIIPPGNIIGGRLNTVPNSATGIIITGDRNSVGENARNVTILNSSGCVVPGDVSEVFILNSSGVTVTTNNTAVMNNVVLYSPSASVGRPIRQVVTGTVTSPPSTAAGSPGIMQGVGGVLTIMGTGNVLVTISGVCQTPSAATASIMQVAYGTGNKPAGGDAATGTTTGSTQYLNLLAGIVPFSKTVYITGLTTGTVYWFDLILYSSAGAGIVNINRVDSVIMEI